MNGLAGGKSRDEQTAAIDLLGADFDQARRDLRESTAALTDPERNPFQTKPEILDACCGGRMWWWDKAHPLAVYMDVREAERGSVGKITGRPEWNPSWECKPDVCASFAAMPFEDESFRLVVFDPPHIVREKQPPEGINGLKYGALPPETEQDDLRRGFAECWRVLVPGGTLVFKWAGPLDRVRPHFPAVPIVGSRNAPRGSKGLDWRQSHDQCRSSSPI